MRVKSEAYAFLPDHIASYVAQQFPYAVKAPNLTKGGDNHMRAWLTDLYKLDPHAFVSKYPYFYFSSQEMALEFALTWS